MNRLGLRLQRAQLKEIGQQVTKSRAFERSFGAPMSDEMQPSRDDGMTIRFQVVPELLRAVQLERMRQPTAWRAAAFVVMIALPALLFCLSLLAGYSALEGIRRLNVALAGPVIWASLPLLSRWYTKRHWSSTPALQGEKTVTFETAGISATTPVGHHEVRWDAIVRVTESRDFVFFFFNGSEYTFVPKAAFPSREDFQAFRGIVTDAIGARARWT